LADKDQTAADRALSSSVNGVTSAAKAAGKAITGFAGGLLDTNPKLSDLASGLGKVNTVIKYLEGNLEALQGFSRYGIDFGMSIGNMNESAAGARLKLEDMARLLSSNTDLLLTFGKGIVGVNGGVEAFLATQRQFFFDQEGRVTEFSKQLERLGLTTKDINESFLIFDAIESYRRRGERLTTEQRNAAAMQFTKTLDKLSKLTGKQTEQLQKEIEAKMRQGDVAAFLTELDTKARESFLEGSQMFKSMGPAVQQLFEDQIIRGFPGEDVAPLVSMMPKTVAAFDEYRRVLKTGTEAERQAALAKALSTAAQEQQTDTMRELAKLGPRVNSNITELYSRVFGEGAFGLAEAIRQVQDEFRKEGKNVDLAGADFLDRVKTRQAEMMKKLTPEEKPGEPVDRGRQATQALIEIQATASSMALKAQNEINKLYDVLGSSANQFAQLVEKNVNVKETVNEVLSTLRSALGLGSSGMGTAMSGVNNAVANAIRANNPELAAEIQVLATKITQASDAERGKLIEQLTEKIKQAVSLTWETQGVILTAKGPVIVNSNEPPSNPALVPPNRRNQNQTGTGGTTNAIGTQGTIGRLFKDFGKETKVALHGVQSVQTPEQTAEIMRNSALGALKAVDNIFSTDAITGSMAKTIMPGIENMAVNNMQTINGMLNTMQNTSRQMVSTANKDMDFNELTNSFKTAVGDLKKPIEDVAKTIKGPMEQLAQTAGQQLEIQQKQLRSINGLNNDVLKGIA